MRRDSIGSLILLAVVALLIVRPWERDAGAGPAAATAPVTRVVDGDTFEARIEGEAEDVRLIGVDTPETVKPGTPVQCYGPRAFDFTHHLLEGRTLSLVFGVERRDIYGRLLVNAILVRRGLARTLTIPPNDRYAPLFRSLEIRAARTGRGLWGAC